MENSTASKSDLATGLAILGLVLGILALLAAFVPILGSFAFFLGVPAAAVSLVALLIALARKAPSGLCVGALLVCLVANAVSWSQYSAIKKMGESSQENIERMFGKPQAAPAIEDVLRSYRDLQQSNAPHKSQTVTISGRVSFGDEERPVPLAQVSAGNFSAATDLEGKFQLDAPSDAKTVVVAAEGFQPLETDSDTIRASIDRPLTLLPLEQADGLIWKTVATIQIQDLGRYLDEFIPRMVIANKHVWLFYKDGYYHCALGRMAVANAWQYCKYPKVWGRNIGISNGIVKGDAFIGYNGGAYHGASDMYTARITESGELVDWQHQFYEPRLERSALLCAWNRLYLLGSQNYDHNNYFGMTTLNDNMTVNKWQYYWYLPQDTFVTPNATADFWGNHLFVASEQESITFEVKEDGTLFNGAFNQRFPAKQGLLRLLCVAGRVYVFTAAGTVYWADVTESPSIYEWKEMRSGLPSINFDIVGRPNSWYDVAKTESGILYIHNYGKKVRLQNNRETVINLLDIYHATIPAWATTKEDVGKVSVAVSSAEATIKPESEIRILRRDVSDGRLIAWDDVQKRWVFSTDDGNTWWFFEFSYDKRNETEWLALEQFPDTREWLAMHQTGLYKVSSDFLNWKRVEGGLPEFQLSTTNFNEWLPQSARIAISPENPKKVLVALDSVIYKSIDAGQHWLRRDNGVRGGDEGLQISFVPGHEDLLLASSTWGLFISKNAGDVWMDFMEWGKSNGWRLEGISLETGNLYDWDWNLVRTPRIGLVYLAKRDWGDGIACAMLDFENSAFIQLASERNIYPGALSDCSSTGGNGESLLIGGEERLFATHDAGKTLLYKESPKEEQDTEPHFSFARNEANPLEVWAGSRGCVLHSQDGGKSWKKLK